MGRTERALILTKQGGRVGSFLSFLGRIEWVLWEGRYFFMGEEFSIEDSSCYCQNSSIIGPRLAPTFSRACCLGDNPQEFLFSQVTITVLVHSRKNVLCPAMENFNWLILNGYYVIPIKTIIGTTGEYDILFEINRRNCAQYHQMD